MSTQIPAWCTRAAEEIAARSLTDNQDGRHSAAIIAKHAPAQSVNEKLIAGLEEINRDAWSDDNTRLRVIARASDELLKLVKSAPAQSAPSLEREAIEALKRIQEMIPANPRLPLVWQIKCEVDGALKR